MKDDNECGLMSAGSYVCLSRLDARAAYRARILQDDMLEERERGSVDAGIPESVARRAEITVHRIDRRCSEGLII